MTVALSRRWALMSNSPAPRESDAAFEVTVGAGTYVALRGISSSKTYSVRWGDGATYSGTATSTSHTYTTAGTYTIETNATLSGSSYQIFGNNSFLRKVISWGSLFKGVTNANYAFSDCSGLTDLPSSWAGLESVTDTMHMFNSCTQLSSIPPSWAGLESVTNAQSMFQGCSKLSSIPSSWAGLESVTNAQSMFCTCFQLSSIPSSWAGLESVTNTYYMFESCYQLSSIPSSWAGLESVTNAQSMFQGCTSLVTGGTADIGALSKVTSCAMMMDGCSSYKGNVLNLYNTLKNGCSVSEDWHRYAFRGCSMADGYADLPYYWKN